MAGLIISYSGIRGIVGESLTPKVAAQYGHAFAALLRQAGHERGRLLIARDTRPSGVELTQAVTQGIGGAFELVDLGVVPTPTLQHAMRPFEAVGAVCVTASHNPTAWNGMKFFLGPDNTVLDGKQTTALCKLAEGDAVEVAATHARPVTRDAHADAVRQHLEAVYSHLDVAKIRKRRFRVALDSARGAGTEISQTLLHELGCEVLAVDASRESEPVPENLTVLKQAVLRERCDLGVAQDLDADRLALVTERGEAPGEERTLVLVLAHLLTRFASGERVVVKNIATTRAVDDVVRAHGATLEETRVGEVNLSRALMRARARGVTTFGGEGNGGVIYPPVSLGRDSIVGIGFVLEALAGEAAPLSQRL
ncbi:MAG: phosphoglucosamine mutase, partial [Myxococcota bacterium]